jgi:hypothetical protein
MANPKPLSSLTLIWYVSGAIPAFLYIERQAQVPRTHRALHIQRAGAEFGRLGYITILLGRGESRRGRGEGGSEEFGAEMDREERWVGVLIRGVYLWMRRMNVMRLVTLT